MAGVLASTAAAVGILDKAVSITQKLANKSDELDKATLIMTLRCLLNPWRFTAKVRAHPGK
jgi:hypothetical protein